MMSAETALGIPLIFERVAQNLSREDLLRCRLVSPVWNKEACKVLQHEQVKFDATPRLTMFNDTFQFSVDGISLTPSRFHFGIDTIVRVHQEDMEMKQKEMERFVEIAGDQVKELDILLYINESNSDLVTLLKVFICKCFPNLNKLALIVLFVNAYQTYSSSSPGVAMQPRLDTGSNCLANLKDFKMEFHSHTFFHPSRLATISDELVSFTAEILSNAVQLKSIYIRFYVSVIIPWLEKSLVKVVVPNLLPPNLKKITLSPELTTREWICALARHSTLTLNDIRIYCIDTSTVPSSDLKQLFNRYHDTLQVLELDFTEPTRMRLPFDIPLRKLRWLSVEHFEGSIEWKKLPAIEVAELSYRSLEEILPHALSYPLNASPEESLDVQWNSKPQTLFITELAEDGYYELPNPSIVTILKGNRTLISFHIIKSNNRKQIDNAKISGKYLSALASHPVYFPIRKFGIIFDEHSVITSDLQRFLNRYHETLYVMDLEFIVPYYICFPLGASMSKLASLTLKNFQGSFEWSKLPELKQVKLDSHSLHAIIPSIVTTPDDCKIDSIECSSGTEQDDHHQDDSYISMFTELAPCLLPKLTRLKIDHNCTVPLSVILSSCTRLKYLELLHSRGVTDNLLCGTGNTRPPLIPTEDLDNDNDEESENDSFMFTQYQTMVKDMRICPYIGDLIELKHLEIQSEDEDADAFSDISVLSGIIDCLRLESLILQSPNLSYERSTLILQQARPNLEHLDEAWVQGNRVEL